MGWANSANLPQIQLNWGSGPLPPSLELGGGGSRAELGEGSEPANLPQIRRASLAAHRGGGVAAPKSRLQVGKRQKRRH